MVYKGRLQSQPKTCQCHLKVGYTERGSIDAKNLTLLVCKLTQLGFLPLPIDFQYE